MTYLETERLVLRRWRAADLAPFAAMNADSRVMEHFPAVYDAERSREAVRKIEGRWVRDGYGLFAVEIKDDGAFAGFVGFAPVEMAVPFVPAVEIGWRLGFAHWGRGYATAAARACLAHGRDDLGFDAVVSFTTRTNTRSMAVMERIGMVRDAAGDFEHPGIPEGHRLRPHVLYRKRLASG